MGIGDGGIGRVLDGDNDAPVEAIDVGKVLQLSRLGISRHGTRFFQHRLPGRIGSIARRLQLGELGGVVRLGRVEISEHAPKLGLPCRYTCHALGFGFRGGFALCGGFRLLLILAVFVILPGAQVVDVDEVLCGLAVKRAIGLGRNFLENPAAAVEETVTAVRVDEKGRVLLGFTDVIEVITDFALTLVAHNQHASGRLELVGRAEVGDSFLECPIQRNAVRRVEFHLGR